METQRLVANVTFTPQAPGELIGGVRYLPIPVIFINRVCSVFTYVLLHMSVIWVNMVCCVSADECSWSFLGNVVCL